EPTLTTIRCAAGICACASTSDNRGSAPVSVVVILARPLHLRTIRRPGVHHLVVLRLPLPRRATPRAIEPGIGAARRLDELRRARQRRLPAELDLVAAAADDDIRPRHRAGLVELLLDAEPGQPVGEVPDGLVIVEIGLRDPALRLFPDHPIRRLRAALDTDREVPLVDRPRPDHDPRPHLRLRSTDSTIGEDELGEREAELPQTTTTHRRNLEDPVAASLELRRDELGE